MKRQNIGQIDSSGQMSYPAGGQRPYGGGNGTSQGSNHLQVHDNLIESKRQSSLQNDARRDIDGANGAARQSQSQMLSRPPQYNSR